MVLVPDYKPNSHKYREEQAAKTEKKLDKVTSGKVKTKKNEMRKFKDVFISEDVSNVKSYIFMDVLVPAIKKAISDIVRDGIDMILYGGTGKSSRGSSGSKISYRSFYDDKRDDRPGASRVRSRFDYDDLVFETRSDAQAVLDQMYGAIERYQVVTIGDMYDAAEVTAPYTSYKYGWTNLRNAKITRVRDGYILELPKAMPID